MVCVRCKGENSDSIVFFYNFLEVSQGLLATIVATEVENTNYSTS